MPISTPRAIKNRPCALGRPVSPKRPDEQDAAPRSPPRVFVPVAGCPSKGWLSPQRPCCTIWRREVGDGDFPSSLEPVPLYRPRFWSARMPWPGIIRPPPSMRRPGARDPRQTLKEFAHGCLRIGEACQPSQGKLSRGSSLSPAHHPAAQPQIGGCPQRVGASLARREVLLVRAPGKIEGGPPGGQRQQSHPGRQIWGRDPEVKAMQDVRNPGETGSIAYVGTRGRSPTGDRKERTGWQPGSVISTESCRGRP